MKMTAREEEKKKKIKEQEQKFPLGFIFFLKVHTYTIDGVCVKDSGIKLSRQRNKQQ
jgi:hypothetical protein